MGIGLIVSEAARLTAEEEGIAATCSDCGTTLVLAEGEPLPGNWSVATVYSGWGPPRCSRCTSLHAFRDALTALAIRGEVDAQIALDADKTRQVMA